MEYDTSDQQTFMSGQEDSLERILERLQDLEAFRDNFIANNLDERVSLIVDKKLAEAGVNQQAPEDHDDDDELISFAPDHDHAVDEEEQPTTRNTNGIEARLSEDTYTLMMLSKDRHWWFGFIIWLLQAILLAMIIVGLSTVGMAQATPFNVPIHVNTDVRAAQFLAIIVALLTTDDLISSIRSIHLLLDEHSVSNHQQNTQAMLERSFGLSSRGFGEGGMEFDVKRLYKRMVIIPNALKMIQGTFALFTSFIIIVQSDNVIELFKEFLALQIVSSIDNVCFWLCISGFFGRSFQQLSHNARKVVLKEHDGLAGLTPVAKWKRLPFHTLSAIAIFLMMVIGWVYTVQGQVTGRFYRLKYPQCQVELQGLDILKIGDGRCDGGLYNRFECGLDGGDCVEFQLAYPGCNQIGTKPWKVSDGNCDNENNFEECGWDGGDCCPVDPDSEVFRNEKCDAMLPYNSEQCDFDGGECKDHNKMYPAGCYVEDVAKLGDGHCDGGAYMSAACEYDKGDCDSCSGLDLDPYLVGNGLCDGNNGGPYILCDQDAGDCDDCLALGVDPSFIGNDECNFGLYMSPQCNYDATDCIEYQECHKVVEHLSLVGDGVCNGGMYLSSECGYDGGDCDACIALGADPSKIGDGICDFGLYLSPECNFDGMDCVEYKECHSLVDDVSKVGDGFCNGGNYMIDTCGMDGKDCEKCAAVEGIEAQLVGDGVCHGGPYIDPNCDDDGGDCAECIALDVDPSKIGDGICDFGFYLASECNLDGGDCIEYKDCSDLVEDISLINNAVCDGGEYMTSECRNDGGDCDDCVDLDGDPVEGVGNDICDSDIMINFGHKCGFDGNDCYGEWEKQGWTRVRHIPQGRNYWYEGNDNLRGIDVRGDPRRNNDESWSINFEETVPGFSEFLFSSGDNTKWLIASKDAVIGEEYENKARTITMSSVNAGSHQVRWYNRGHMEEDPWISLVDHDDATTSDFLYGENAYATNFLDSLKNGGLDVYIRYDSCFAKGVDALLLGNGECDGGSYMTPECDNDNGDCNECTALGLPVMGVGDGKCDPDIIINFGHKCGFDGNDCYGEWEKQGWTRVRHIPQGRNYWYEGNDNLQGTDVRGDPRRNNDESWSINFEEAVPGFNEFLFSSGDNTKWLIASKDAVIGEHYEDSLRRVESSSINAYSHQVRWYNRADVDEDPWISLVDHFDATSSDFLYGEDSYSSRSFDALKNGGIDVYIRHVPF